VLDIKVKICFSPRRAPGNRRRRSSKWTDLNVKNLRKSAKIWRKIARQNEKIAVFEV
jgi:CO dehydrogenase/acetyl-CoA synthase alpha subunit